MYLYSDNPTIRLEISDDSTMNSLTSSTHLEFLQDVTGKEILELFEHKDDDVQLCSENDKTFNLDESLYSQGVTTENKLIS